MTKLTEYTSPAKQEAKLEAQRRKAEVQVLQKQLPIWKEIKLSLVIDDSGGTREAPYCLIDN